MVCADIKTVDRHCDVLEDIFEHRVAGNESMNGSWPLRCHEVEDKVAWEGHVVLLDVDGRAEGRYERSGVVRAVERNSPSAFASERANGKYKMRDRTEVLSLPGAPIRRT